MLADGFAAGDGQWRIHKKSIWVLVEFMMWKFPHMVIKLEMTLRKKSSVSKK